MPRALSTPLAGWGRYPVEPVHLYRPERTADLSAILAARAEPNYIARGLGRSYSDTALNRGGGVILQTQLNRLLAFDAASGVLRCEAGVSLADILTVFVPRGYFLPVTPGTKYVTVGGAIANDVHGKNHHAHGSFANFLLDFTLLTAPGQVLTCSRTEHPDLFWATVGGIGLTGIILQASIRLLPVESAYYLVEYRQAGNLEQALTLLQGTEALFPYSVAWIDCLASGRALGRSVLMLGQPVPRSARPPGEPLTPHRPPRLRLPVDFPGWLLNPVSIGAFNQLYYWTHRAGRKVTHYEAFFYPLDAIGQWNRLYGKNGFVQYQVVFPPETSRAGLTELLERLTRNRTASFLAVLKSFGAQGQGLLSFPRRGYTLALDIPARNAVVLQQLRDLEELVLRHDGRVYLGKDALLTPAGCVAMYPELPRFRAIQRSVDPEQRFSSSMARRLGLLEE